MGRARHSRRGRGGTVFGPIFSILVVVFVFAVTLPSGSVGFMAMQGGAALAWMLGVAGILGGWAGSHEEAKPADRLFIGAMVLFLGWCGWQLVPLPESWAGFFWRGDAELWKRLSAGASGWTIAVDRFVSIHTLLLWSGLGVLSWGCSRQPKGSFSRAVVLFGLMWMGVLQSILGIFFLRSPTGRICGTFGSPDALGGLLAMTIPVTVGLLFSHIHWRERRGSSILHRLGYDWVVWRNVLLVAAFGIQGTALYFTGSRGAAFATLVAMVMLLVWLGRERPELRSRLWWIGLALLVVTVLFGIQGRRANLMERTFGQSGEFHQAKASRVEIWRSAFALCRNFPYGTGPGGTVLMLPMYQTGAYGRFRLDYAHNDFLQFWGDLGVVGFGALACVLGLVLRRGAGGCRKASENHVESAWWMRGAWAAVLAALFHAQVDFNLSGRPGIQVVFAILCGLLMGENPNDGEFAEIWKGKYRKRWLVRAAILLPICALAVHASLRAALAWRLHDGAAAALGLAVDEHLWFERPDVNPEDVLPVLEKATKLAPGFSKIHCTAAEAQLVRQDQQIQQAAKSILQSSGEEGTDVWNMEALLPSQESALRLAGLALRVEEMKGLESALKEANEAVRLAPWDALARLMRSKVWLRGHSRKMGDEEAALRARRDLELVTALYPLDAGILADACLALAMDAGDPETEEDLLEWGGRALEMDSSLGLTVLRAWRMARIPVSRMLEIPKLPFSFLWSLYTSLQKQNRESEAEDCLLALENSLDRQQPPDDSTLWTPALWKNWNILQAQYRLQIAAERIKRCLKAGDWEGLQRLSETRAKLRHDRFQIEWDRMGLSETSSPVLRRLRLREWEMKQGLFPEWLLEWNLLELESGMSAKWMQETLAEGILLDGISSENLKRLNACRSTMADAKFLEGVLDAKNMEANGKTAEALSRVELLLNSGTVPPRFLHRIGLWRASLLEREGQATAAVEAIQAAAMACSSDSDVKEAMERLGAASRDRLQDMEPQLNIGFRGDRLRLKQVYFSRETEGTNGLRMHLVWRFRGGLPPDLAMEVRIRDQEGRVLVKKNAIVDQETSAHFNRGNPIPGSQWTWTVLFPPKAEEGKRVEILLLSDDKLLISDEGLFYIELNMKKLPLIP